MVCPYCECKSIKTTNSRKTKRNNQVWRRRQCESCGRLFTTREIIDFDGVTVTKSNGKSEPYSRAKLLSSIIKCSDHLDGEQLEKAYYLFETIEQNLMKDTIEIKDIILETTITLGLFNQFCQAKYQSYYSAV